MSGVNARRREEELENRVKMLEGAIIELIDGESAYSLTFSAGLTQERCQEIIDLIRK